ncbi:hypothetical protein TIFTF001_024656 [Ficus carica]|uniref:BRX domain-containing protein n=1 Tax=Ficus carica TaxID=3494 RepID=A0AA88ANQ3_FICCA|nr:hypothetical protein TIFTF001_024656 [Ficus carica]
MTPNPDKPYRVCYNCFEKLRTAAQTSPSSHYTLSRRGSVNQGVNEIIEKNKSLDSGSHMKEDNIASFKRNKKLSFDNNRVYPFKSNLTSKSRLREIELEKATRQLKDAIAKAAEETEKCKAVKEVIKSLTAQLKDMAARLPTRMERSRNTLPLYSASHTQIVFAAVTDQRNSPVTCPTSKIKGRAAKSKTITGDEWVEQDEAGIYFTLASLSGGLKYLKRVRFRTRHTRP